MHTILCILIEISMKIRTAKKWGQLFVLCNKRWILFNTRTESVSLMWLDNVSAKYHGRGSKCHPCYPQFRRPWTAFTQGILGFFHSKKPSWNLFLLRTKDRFCFPASPLKVKQPWGLASHFLVHKCRSLIVPAKVFHLWFH